MNSRLYPICLCIINLTILVQSAPPDKHQPLECGENEYYEKCSLAVCQKVCRHIFVPVACPSVSSDCYQPECLCKPGYLRNPEGICIPLKTCEAVCEANEEFTDCTYNVCRPQLCFDKGLQRSCQPVDREYCNPGCVCKEKYLMENGTCIPENECTESPWPKTAPVIQ